MEKVEKVSKAKECPQCGSRGPWSDSIHGFCSVPCMEMGSLRMHIGLVREWKAQQFVERGDQK